MHHGDTGLEEYWNVQLTIPKHSRIIRKNMDVNKHERLSIFTLGYKLK
jgi:hypothetical protein